MRRLLYKLLRRRRLRQDLETELAFHREMSKEHQNPIPLGNTTAIKEQALDLWRFNFIENLWRDLVYAARGLRRSPGLVVSALLSLALGIGVNAAMFSLGVEFLFSEPSVRDAGSLVSIRLGGSSSSPEEAIDFLRTSDLFQSVAGEDQEAFSNFNDGAETHRIFAVYTTQNYFTALGLPMLSGRGALPDDRKEVAVLSYRFFRRYFNGDPSIVGRVINLDGRMCTVVGVLGEHHRTLLGFGFSPDVYVPKWLDTTKLSIYARLKPGMSLGEARAGLHTVAKRMDAAIPARWKYAQNLSVSPIAGYARLTSQPETMTIGIFFVVLLAVTGLVLIIACVNVASLLLARASARRGEIAIRLALGASRGRLLQQLLAESVLLAFLGAGFGLVLSQATATLLARVQLPLPVPIYLQITPDWRVAAYCALLTTLAILVCGLLPALQSVKDSIAPDLRRESKLGLRQALVAAQIAISVIVLSTGFLFLRNLVNANAISPGFDVRNTLRADVNLPPGTYIDKQHKTNYIDHVLRELAVIPGVESVAAARITPFTDNVSYGSQLKFPDNGQQTRAYFKWNAVTPAFFQAMGIPITRGRAFSTADRGERVAIVNQTFVQRFLDNRQPIGTVFLWGADENTPYRIVGVVEGTKTITIGEEPQPQLYEPLAQIDNNRLRIQFVIRSAILPGLQLDAVRRTLRRIDPTAGAEVETMYSSIGLAFLPSQIGAVLLGSIGILGLLLATVGLYGIMGYSVIRRTREIGVRVAIGATRGDISRMMLLDSARLTLTGSAIGLFIALFLTKPLTMFLVPGLKSSDPMSLVAVLLVMIVTGVLAAWGPMRRALAVDPNTALRYE
jgi:predicted permease